MTDLDAARRLAQEVKERGNETVDFVQPFLVASVVALADEVERLRAALGIAARTHRCDTCRSALLAPSIPSEPTP